MKIDELKHDPRNPRKHNKRNLDTIALSLQELGAARSIVIDENNQILAGNGVIQAAGQVGLENVQVVDADGQTIIAVRRKGLTDKQKKRMAVYDNQAGVLAEWDAEVMAALTEDDPEMVETIFSDQEWNEILKELGADKNIEDPGAEISKADELCEKWQVKSGQLWQLGDHRVICGDCTDRAVVERVMEGEKAALVITDPPYGVGYADKNAFLNAIARGNRIQEPIENDHEGKVDTQKLWKAAFVETFEVMVPGAVIYCFSPQTSNQIRVSLVQSMIDCGLEPHQDIIWLKNNHVLGRVDYAYKHEPILYAWKEGGHKFYGDFQTSVLEFPKPTKSDLHPTTKPVELIERLVENSSMRLAIVFDGFIGSGTTLIACERLGRRCRGIEISPSYVAVTIERWASATKLEPVLLG